MVIRVVETYNITNTILADLNRAMARRADRDMLKIVSDYAPVKYGWFRTWLRKWLGITKLDDYARVHLIIRIEDLENR